MYWLFRIMARRQKRPALVRWLGTLALFALALAGRVLLGYFGGGLPALTFFPVLLIVTVLFGWVEALAVLALSATAGVFLFLPPGGYLTPVGWVFVGSLTIVIVTALKTGTQELIEANERQRVLFQELQHRVANTLQSVVGRLESARHRVDADPSGAKEILDEAVLRFSASADVHRRLSDPSLFERGLKPILTDAVESVIDTQTTNVSFDISPLNLSLDQLSIITMLVIEAANNAQKHVFGRNKGTHFLVSLRLSTQNRAVLVIVDDGPGWTTRGGSATEVKLGLTVLEGLAKQLGGTLHMKTQKGTEISVMFPLPPA